MNPNVTWAGLAEALRIVLFVFVLCPMIGIGVAWINLACNALIYGWKDFEFLAENFGVALGGFFGLVCGAIYAYPARRYGMLKFGKYIVGFTLLFSLPVSLTPAFAMSGHFGFIGSLLGLAVMISPERNRQSNPTPPEDEAAS